MEVVIKIYKGDLELAVRAARQTPAYVIQEMIDTAHRIYEKYPDKIKQDYGSYRDNRRPFSRLRIFLKTGIQFRYSFFISRDDANLLSVCVKQVKSKTCLFFKEDQIREYFFTEQMNDMLLGNFGDENVKRKKKKR